MLVSSTPKIDNKFLISVLIETTSIVQIALEKPPQFSSQGPWSMSVRTADRTARKADEAALQVQEIDGGVQRMYPRELKNNLLECIAITWAPKIYGIIAFYRLWGIILPTFGGLGIWEFPKIGDPNIAP